MKKTKENPATPIIDAANDDLTVAINEILTIALFAAENLGIEVLPLNPSAKNLVTQAIITPRRDDAGTPIQGNNHE